MFTKRVLWFLEDIVADADRVTAFTEGMDSEALADDEKTLLAVERLFQRITEAVIQIGANDMALVGVGLPIKQIRDFGNRLRHDYRNIDPEVRLRAAREDLPALRAAAARALEH